MIVSMANALNVLKGVKNIGVYSFQQHKITKSLLHSVSIQTVASDVRNKTNL